MKKKILILCLSALLLSTNASSRKITIFPTTKGKPQYPKSPASPLTIDITDHTLTLFSAFEDAITIELLNEEDNVVFTDCLVPGQTSLVFPDTLSGEYTIRLTVGSIYYIGVIEL